MEVLENRGTKRKADLGPEPDIMPDLEAALAKPAAATPLPDASTPASSSGSEGGGVVSAAGGAKYPAFSSVLVWG